MAGILTLIPTPLNDQQDLESHAKALLKDAWTQENNLVVVEELKIARRRWLHWGLPREAIEKFSILNEHNQEEASHQFLQQLKQGKNIYLFSDSGLPAFCDPGTALVDLCHLHQVKVTSTPFPHSISLALALSGYFFERFVFEGFPPVESVERKKQLKRMVDEKSTVVLMDTPYRLKRLLEELEELIPQRQLFLALDLNLDTEELLRDTSSRIQGKIKEWKREFILVLSPIRY